MLAGEIPPGDIVCQRAQLLRPPPLHSAAVGSPHTRLPRGRTEAAEVLRGAGSRSHPPEKVGTILSYDPAAPAHLTPI